MLNNALSICGTINPALWAGFLLGFMVCAVIVCLQKLLASWLYGIGILPGEQKRKAVGNYAETSRGRVHYVYLKSAKIDDAVLLDLEVNNSNGATGQLASDTDDRPVSDWVRRSSGDDRMVNNRFVDEESLRTPMLNRDEKPDDLEVFGTVLKPGMIRGSLVVILHGYAGSSDAFVSDLRSGYARFLQSKDYNVLIPDLYGQGHSDGPDTEYSSELFVEQLAELCLIFGLTEPFDLIGFSMGGSVATQFAFRYPYLVRHLILQAPHVVEAPLQLSLRIALQVPLFREVLGYFILPFVGEIRNNPAALRACFRLLLTQVRGGGRWSSPGKGGSSKQMLKELDKLGKRISVLWGEKDTVCHFWQAKVLMSLVPSSTLVSHSEATHMDFADGNTEIREFFREALFNILRSESVL